MNALMPHRCAGSVLIFVGRAEAPVLQAIPASAVLIQPAGKSLVPGAACRASVAVLPPGALLVEKQSPATGVGGRVVLAPSIGSPRQLAHLGIPQPHAGVGLVVLDGPQQFDLADLTHLADGDVLSRWRRDNRGPIVWC